MNGNGVKAGHELAPLPRQAIGLASCLFSINPVAYWTRSDRRPVGIPVLDGRRPVRRMLSE